MTDLSAAATPRAQRRTVVRIAALLLAVLWGFFFYGLIDLLAFVQGPEFHDGLLLSTGWGLVFLFLVAAPLAAVVVRPDVAPVAAVQTALVAAALAAGAVISGSYRHLAVTAGLLLTAFVVAALAAAPTRLLRRGWRWSWARGALVLCAVGPSAAYARAAGRAYGVVPGDRSIGLDHWPVQAAFPLAVLLVAALAAGRPRDWQVPAWCAAAAALWFAAVCWAEPDLSGSISRPWSVATAIWAVAFVVAARWSARGDAVPVPVLHDGGATS